MDQRPGSGRLDDRGLSEVLGFALVFALVVSTVILVALIGFGSLEETRDAEELNNAERAFDVLADNMADIYEEGAPSRATEISLQSAQLQVGDPIMMNVSAINASGGTEVNQFPIDPIVFESGDSKVLYAGGATFRTQGDNGVMVAGPPLVNASENLLLPIVQTRHRGDVTSTSGQTVRVRAVNRQRRSVPGFNEDPTSHQKIILNITSPRAGLWKSYLTEQQQLSCVTPREDNVRCTVDDPESVFLTRTLIIYEFET
ncbi:hypothetical protein DV733_01690 [Halapricum salinum]|uniref:Uncharacterized protein n=1 Tax=Halapricum salinum TaxID=1457250 RepID=A0A4D6H862_9EURY|nr:hypothetical protein [Halapricum salinum]QCC50009.1 hypothetical protein DV733_01690 [Halapricum salinum]